MAIKFGKFRSVVKHACIAFAMLGAASAYGQGNIDPITTSATARTYTEAARKLTSEEFRDALALFDKEKYSEAHEAGQGLSNSLERRIIQWSAIYFGNGDVDPAGVVKFQADAPLWAPASIYKTRLEQALTNTNPEGKEVIKQLGGEMPNTIDGQIALARAYVADGQAERAGRILKEVWTINFLNSTQEKTVHREFGSLLAQEDHWLRAQHLLMHDRARGTERILNDLTPAQRTLARARIAVSRKVGGAKAILNSVDPSMTDHYVFHFASAQLARSRGQYAEAVAHLDKVGGDFIDSEEFWYERRLIARRALAIGATKIAYDAAAGYTEGPEGRLVEAHFHAGWISLAYLDEPAIAAEHFKKQRALSTLPRTIAQSNYWLGMALKASGGSGAKSAFSIAGKYDKLFYGQLARAELGQTPVKLRNSPSYKGYISTFERYELVRAVRLLVGIDRQELAEPLLVKQSRTLRTSGELLLAARLAQEIGAHDIAISIAGFAENRGFALDYYAFPHDGIPAEYKLALNDRAAVYAVARQESKFDGQAVSRAGALGLMQLMPATAQETARKAGVVYSSAKLTSDPAYNALLGSTYLAAQLKRYNGSLVLAAAAYNGGPGNVNKWLQAFGDPRNLNVDPVSWTESIPFPETRLYVQRVMGNYLVYRARQGDTDLDPRALLRNISP